MLDAPSAAPSEAEDQTPATQAPPTPPENIEVTFGKTLNVPDNFLGAGYTGRGWTIVGTGSQEGKQTIKLARRIKDTHDIETHEIDVDTYHAAKEYKDRQRGPSKGWKAPVIEAGALGQALDAQGDLVPDFFDGASRSYRVRLPGGRTPQWVPESLIRDFKQGKPGALARLRTHVGLDENNSAATTASPADAITQGVAQAILGKRLANRFARVGEKRDSEKAPDRPSTQANTSSPARKVNAQNKRVPEATTPEERAAEEDNRRQAKMSQRRQERLQAEEDEEADTKKSSAQNTKVKSPLLTPAVVGRETADSDVSQPQITKTQAKKDPVKAVKDGVAQKQTNDKRFQELLQNPEFKRTVFVDIDKVPTAARQQIVKQTLFDWDQKQRQSAIDGIEAEYKTLENDPAFRKHAYETGLQYIQTHADDYYRRNGRQTKVNENGWVIDAQTGENLGHVFSVALDNQHDVIPTEQQIKQQAITSWKNQLEVKATSTPSSPSTGSKTKKPRQVSDIRRFRELMRAQQRSGSNAGGAVSARAASTASESALALATAGAGISTAAGRMALKSLQGTTAIGLEASSAAQTMTREEALRRVRASLGQARQQANQLTVDLTQGLLSSSATSPTDGIQGEGIDMQRPRSSGLSTDTTDDVQSSVPASAAWQNTRQTLSQTQQQIASLAQMEQALSALSAGTMVSGSAGVNGISLGALPLAISGRRVAGTPVGSGQTGELPALSDALDEESFSEDASSTENAPSLSTPLSSPSSTRVGAPPVSLRSSSSSSSTMRSTNAGTVGGGGALGGSGRGELAPPLRSMVNLNAGQAARTTSSSRGSSGDAYEQALGRDTSTAEGAAATSTPLDIKNARAFPSTSDVDTEEDTFRTRGMDEERSRLQAENSQAFMDQFSGGDSQASVDGAGTSSPVDADGGPLPGPDINPTDARIAAIKLEAAQARDRRGTEQTDSSTQTGDGATTTTQSDVPFMARFTKIKLVWDLIEGLFDGLGFFEFLSEANLALVNDKYLHLEVLPTLKTSKQETSKDRYIRYAVYLADGLVITAVAIMTFLLVLLIYMIVNPL